jgi:hypothetical protein
LFNLGVVGITQQRLNTFMRRAILRDIHDLGLDPTKCYSSVGPGGRLRTSTAVNVSIVVEPVVEQQIIPEPMVVEQIPETVIVEQEQVQSPDVKEDLAIEPVQISTQDEVKIEQPKKRQRKQINQQTVDESQGD